MIVYVAEIGPRRRDNETANLNRLPALFPLFQPIAFSNFAQIHVAHRRRRQIVNAQRVEQFIANTLAIRCLSEICRHAVICSLSSERAGFHQRILDSLACRTVDVNIERVPSSRLFLCVTQLPPNPYSSSSCSLLRQSSSTFTNNSRCTRWPTSASISLRARMPMSFKRLAPFPMMIFFCVPLSTTMAQ